MIIKQEIDLDITPTQIARLIYEGWADDDVIEFLNGLGLYQKDMQELLSAASDRIDKLDSNGKWMLNLIKEYLEEMKKQINRERGPMENAELVINGRQLTNIGVFRHYALNYLKQNEHIDQEGTLMVRQLENTPQGMPLEIYCFTNDSLWENYEVIMADIFDHLMVASKEFDLEIMQLNKI